MELKFKLFLLPCNFERGAGDGVWQSGSSCAIQEVKNIFVNLQLLLQLYNSKILMKKGLQKIDYSENHLNNRLIFLP